MDHATVEIVIGSGLVLVACGFVIHGVWRLLHARSYESGNRCALDGLPTFHRPRECNKRNTRIAHDALGILVTQMQELKHPLRQTGRRARYLRFRLCASPVPVRRWAAKA